MTSAIANPHYTAAVHGEYELFSVGRLDLEEGGAIPDCHLAVATFGELSAAKDNAVLVPTWYSGTHGVWRDVYIGDDHALDPSRWFVVVVDQIGSGLSTSPHNAEGPNTDLAMAAFPHVRVGDDVVAQERLLREHFGIETLALVVGGSMGAQQTYEWAVRFPEKVRRAAPIAGRARATDHDVLFVRTLMEAITSDPGFASGAYASHEQVRAGLERHARTFGVTGFSGAFWRQRVYAALGFDDMDAFLAGFLEPYFGVMDPNDLLTMLWKWRHGDVARHTGGDLAQALGRIRAATFVIAIDHDAVVPVDDCAAERALIDGAELRVVDDVMGHLALFGYNPTFLPQVDRHLRDLLAVDVG